MSFFDPIWLLAVLVALTVHEWSHAMTATRLGDPTPSNEGRLTLNPIAHLDPIGTLMMLFGPFGWAKPVPINPSYFKNHKMGTLLTAAAGPFSNLILAIIAYFALAVMIDASAIGSFWNLLAEADGQSVTQTFFLRFLRASLFVNLGLMAFNLIPIAPLDGSKVLQAFIPLQLEDRYDELMRYGPYILLTLLLAEYFLNIPLLSSWIGTIMNGILWVLTSIMT